MARKVRRVKTTAPRVAETTATNKSAPAARPAAVDEETLRDEYTYVIKDLRRIFILAVLMFLLLIALNVLL